MKYFIISLITFVFAANVMAQDKHDFSIELNVNGTNHEMGLVNDYFTKDPYFPYTSVTKRNNHLNSLNFGLDYTLGINYQPFHFMDFGVFANYQSATIKRSFTYEDYPDPSSYPDSSITRDGKINTQVNALSLGISSNIYLNKIFHLDRINSIFLKKMIIFIGLKGGIGYSTFNEQASNYYYSTNTTYDYTNFQYKATNLNGRAEIGIGYPIYNKSFFSSVGFKIGYQYFKTSPVKNYAGTYLYHNDDYNNPDAKVSLDFSGVYYGVYLRIGKH